MTLSEIKKELKSKKDFILLNNNEMEQLSIYIECLEKILKEQNKKLEELNEYNWIIWKRLW